MRTSWGCTSVEAMSQGRCCKHYTADNTISLPVLFNYLDNANVDVFSPIHNVVSKKLVSMSRINRLDTEQPLSLSSSDFDVFVRVVKLSPHKIVHRMGTILSFEFVKKLLCGPPIVAYGCCCWRQCFSESGGRLRAKPFPSFAYFRSLSLSIKDWR